MLKKNLALKNCYDVNSRVHTSIFAKFSNLPFDLEIEFNGGLRHAEHEYRNRKILRCTLERLRVDFQKIQICP